MRVPSVAAAGNTLFEGFTERLTKELKSQLGDAAGKQLKVEAPAERKYSVFLGGSIYAQTAAFQQQLVTKELYDEFGPPLAHRFLVM